VRKWIFSFENYPRASRDAQGPVILWNSFCQQAVANESFDVYGGLILESLAHG
jgi:hypothetical protein